MDNLNTLYFKVSSFTPQQINDSLISSTLLLLGMLFFLVILFVIMGIVRKKRKSNNGVIDKEIHRYNLFLNVSTGLQVAFMLEVVNIMRKMLLEGNIYLIDLIITLFLMVLWLGEELILTSQFVKD